MLQFAVSATEKMQTLSLSVWIKISIALAAVVIAVLVYRRVMKMNKIIAGVIIFVVSTVVFFSWVYNRNEPKFLTPVVEKISPFFPSASDFKNKQHR